VPAVILVTVPLFLAEIVISPLVAPEIVIPVPCLKLIVLLSEPS
jgi:hypothetical protein